MTFLLDNKNRVKQYGYPRRGGGYTAAQITVHTYEAPHTRSLIAAATYLLERTNHGSYHALAGAKSKSDVLQLAPWSYETWHSTPNNNWAVGISAVAYAHQWDTIPQTARDNLVGSMAYLAAQAARWLKDAHGRHVEPRWLTRAQAMRKESGFVMHSVMDPGRRQDAGDTFPRSEFFAEFNRLMSANGANLNPTATAPERTWFDMATEADLKKIVREELNAALNNDVIDVLRSGNIKKISAMDALQNTDGGMNSILGTVLAHTGELAGLKTAVSQLADSQGINGDDIIGAVEAAVSKALPAEITVPLSPKEA